MMTKIAIFDYGSGNLFSLKSALERNGGESVSIIYNLKELPKFDGLVLPGVGNFDPAIRAVQSSSAEYLDKAIDNCMPLLGICLGMEILFNKSEEGKLEGLKILDGEVVMLPKGKVKVPHMGWNNLQIKSESKLLKGIKDQSWVYFVHSYKTVPKDHRLIMATSNYGINIPAMIEKNNLMGVQFHPEKSGDVGALILKNFIALCKKDTK